MPARRRRVLHEEHHRRNAEREFLEDGDGHQRPIASGIPSDEEEDELPDQRQPDEAVEVLQMSDGGWRIASDAVEQEVLRCEYRDPVDAGGAEDDAREPGAAVGKRLGRHDAGVPVE
jgi:hypothetical protein